MSYRTAVMIRHAGAADAAAIADLVRQLGYASTEDEVRARLEEMTAEHAVFVASSDRVIGFIHVSVVPNFEGETFGEIRALSVDEKSRGNRVGEELVRAAEEWVRARGLKKIRVRSNVIRTRARQFYERLGYVVTKAQNVFDKVI